MQTPRLVLSLDKLIANIQRMQTAANEAGVALRPHIKAHKSAEITKLQLKAGAKGITVAKLGEAEVMADAGAEDIFVAYQLIGDEQYERIAALKQRVALSVAVDNLEHCRALSAHKGIATLDVLIEVDTGLGRCGVLPQDVPALAREIAALPNLHLKGIFTHAGQAYGAHPEEVERIGKSEATTMVECARALRRLGINVDVVSTGSTPTALYNLQVPGVTEIRPGNYVFNDNIQIGLGIASEEQCALTVESTVISIPAPNRAIIDAGSKVFGLDKGAHGTSVVNGFGRVIGRPDIIIERLSEEHGIIVCTGSLPALGEKLTVIPNHACVAVNLTEQLWVNGESSWKVSARGRVY